MPLVVSDHCMQNRIPHHYHGAPQKGPSESWQPRWPFVKESREALSSPTYIKSRRLGEGGGCRTWWDWERCVKTGVQVWHHNETNIMLRQIPPDINFLLGRISMLGSNKKYRLFLISNQPHQNMCNSIYFMAWGQTMHAHAWLQKSFGHWARLTQGRCTPNGCDCHWDMQPTKQAWICAQWMLSVMDAMPNTAKDNQTPAENISRHSNWGEDVQLFCLKMCSCSVLQLSSAHGRETLETVGQRLLHSHVTTDCVLGTMCS